MKRGGRQGPRDTDQERVQAQDGRGKERCRERDREAEVRKLGE